MSSSAKRLPLIVELVGTPGAGKTTLSDELVALLREQGIEAATVLDAARKHAGRTLLGRVAERIAPYSLRRQLLWQVFYLLSTIHAFGFSRDHPSLARQVLRDQMRRPIPFSARHHILFWFFQLAGRHRFLVATSKEGEVLVVDDGFLHRAVHLNASHVHEPDPERVAAYVDLLPEADLAVFTLADREVCERRVRERGVWPHSRHLSAAELSQYLRNAEAVAGLAVRRARERGWRVVEIDNNDRSPDQIRGELKRALEAPLHGGGGAADMTNSTRILHVPRPSRISGYLAARLGPPVIESARVRDVLDRYGLQPIGGPRNLRLGRRSRNVAVRTDAGEKVVKLYRPQWTPAAVRYGHSILARLEELDFPALRVTRTHDGASWTGVDGELFAVFDLLPGTNYSLNFLLRSDRLQMTATAGRILAGLHRCLEGFVPDGEHHLGFVSPIGARRRDASWHMAKLDELEDRSAELTDREAVAHADRLIGRAAYLLDSIDRLDRDLADAFLPRLVIHGDYGLHNLIFLPTGEAVPLDFELSRLDWRLNDLISALGKYRYRGNVYDFESMETFLRAYATAFPLAADERRRLPDAWRLYKLQAAVQYWNSYFETNGPTRKLASALDSIDQADWVAEHPETIRRLSEAGGQPPW